MNSKSVLAAVALILASIANAQTQAPAAGRLLVANPGVDDPNFAESVLLILLHQDGGSAGIFLNRPTWVDPSEAFPEVDSLEAYDGALFLGGPVGVAELLTLFEFEGQPLDDTIPVSGGLYFSPNPALLDRIDFALASHPKVRVYAGHAEWGPGQLAAEIAAGRWRLVSPEPGNIFVEEPERLWQKLMLASDGVSASIF